MSWEIRCTPCGYLIDNVADDIELVIALCGNCGLREHYENWKVLDGR